MMRSACLALVVLLVGCGSDDANVAPVTPVADSSTEDAATVDTAADDTATPVDAPADSSPDAGSDARAETGAVACTETGGKLFPGNGHCYFPLPTQKTLIGAANECKTLGGAHIVTITSGEEQDFIKNNIGTGEQWIGLTSTKTTTLKSDFDWLGGEPVTYDGWAAGFPASRGRCAVQTAVGKWEDRSCSDELKIGVCERE